MTNANDTTANETTKPDPTTAAPFADDDPRAVFAGAVALGGAVIARVRPEQMSDPTPCPGMDVRRLVGHLVMVMQRVACAGRGDDPTTWPEEVEGLGDGEWIGAWRAGAHDVQAVWTDDSILARPTALPWTTVTGTEALQIYTNEVVVHTWDLARATGQRPEWDDRVVGAALDAIRVHMPAEGRMESFEAAKRELPPDFPWEDPFGPAVAVADDAPLIDRLVAWNGRDPGA